MKRLLLLLMMPAICCTAQAQSDYPNKPIHLITPFNAGGAIDVPTLRVVPNPRVASYGKVESIGWVLPIDDTNFRVYVAGRVAEKGELGRFRSKMAGKSWHELTEDEHRRYPGDYEAQTGQGPITLHSEEHLSGSDGGVARLRRFLEQQLKIVAGGGDPACVAFNEKDAYLRLEAGQSLEDAARVA